MRSLPPSKPFFMSFRFSAMTSAAIPVTVSRVCLMYLYFLVGSRCITWVNFSGTYSAMKVEKSWYLELFPRDWALTKIQSQRVKLVAADLLDSRQKS